MYMCYVYMHVCICVCMWVCMCTCVYVGVCRLGWRNCYLVPAHVLSVHHPGVIQCDIVRVPPSTHHQVRPGPRPHARGGVPIPAIGPVL